MKASAQDRRRAAPTSLRADDAEPLVRAVAAAARPVKHSFSIAGHRTSISLEHAFWEALGTAARTEGLTLAELVRRIDQARGDAGLSGAVRVWVLAYVQAAAGGHPGDARTTKSGPADAGKE